MTLILDPVNPLATKVQTRDGRKARLICVDRKGSDCPIAALTEYDYGSREAIQWCTRGGYYNNNGITSDDDLINAPVEHRVWQNWYKNSAGPWSCTYSTRESADGNCDAGRIACVEVVFKEGDGL